MKNFVLALGACTMMLASCGGNTGNKEKKADIIEDAKLYPFMLGGIYFFHGYDGSTSFLNTMAKGQMDSKPGSAGFINELHKIYTEYFYFPFKPEEGAGARKTLSDYWEMTDKASFQKEMEILITEGHQNSYQKLANGGKTADAEDKDRLAFINAHKNEFSKGGIKAWDIARYVNNTAMGVAAGYVTQDEANAMLAKLPALAHASYNNWDEYWKAYNLGRKFWGGDKENDAAYDKDVTDMQQGDYSIYKYMKW